MGWLFNSFHERPRDVIQHIMKPDFWASGTRVVAKCSRAYGRRLWTLVETEGEGTWICLFLIDGDSRNGWGYKAVEEFMGPVEVDCPVSYIERATAPPDSYAAEWRRRVLEHAARGARRFSDLDRVLALGKPGTVRYRMSRTRNSYVVDLDDGRTFRYPAQHLVPEGPVLRQQHRARCVAAGV